MGRRHSSAEPKGLRSLPNKSEHDLYQNLSYLPKESCFLFLSWQLDIVHQSQHFHALDDAVSGIKLPPLKPSVC